jgi:hypothetical protein
MRTGRGDLWRASQATFQHAKFRRHRKDHVEGRPMRAPRFVVMASDEPSDQE